MIRRFSSLFALLPLTFALGACTTDSDESVEPVTTPAAGTGFVATFKPDLALMPFPTDVWRNGSDDGTLNIYAGNEAFESDPLIGQIEQMNLLDGFGLNADIYADFNAPIDEESLVLGETVHVYNVAVGGTPQPTLVPANDLFEVSTAEFQGGRSVVQLTPVQPLDPLTTYAVFLTEGIQASDGTAASADAAFQAMIEAYQGNGAQDLESETLQGIFAGMVQSLLAMSEVVPGIGGPDNLVSAWTFTTQSIGQSLTIVDATATAQTNAFLPIPANGVDYAAGVATTADLNSQLAGLADVYIGAIEVPYYLDPASPLTSYWEAVDASCQTAIDAGLISVPSASTTAYCPQPEVQATVTVPVLLTVPNASANAANPGCTANQPTGIVIFQHGITQDRSNALAVADSFAQACQAVIAIDLPLHGITNTANGLYAAAASPLYAGLDNVAPGISAGITEQTFNLDVDADGTIDPSGEYFINLQSPITARDALRQAVANLIHLTATIPTINYDVALAAQGVPGTDLTPDFEAPTPIRFVGHSLGAITGTTYLGVDASAGAAALVAPGGDVADLIVGSDSIFPEVEAGLAENGLTQGMRFFDEFFRNAQTIIEAGDPINYAASANALHPIVMIEMVGGAGVPPDAVVPNDATEMLAAAMGLDVVTTTTAAATPIDGLVPFSVGDHGSLLSPASSLAATRAMQSLVVQYVASGGTAIVISDPSVIAQ